jgi:hypothetical protein
MTERKITFTVKSIEKDTPLAAIIESAEFTNKEGGKAVERIIFCGSLDQ